MNKKPTEPTTENYAAQFAHLTDDGLGGFSQLTGDKVALPFLRILQSLSPQLKKTKAEYNPAAEEGMFCNSATNEVYGTSIDVVVGRFDHAYLAWKPQRGGFAGRWGTADIQRGIAEGDVIRGENGLLYHRNGNDLSETYTYAVLLPDHVHEGVMLFATSSTLLKPARAWNRLLINTFLPNGQRALPYFMIFNLESVMQSNEKGDWYGFKASFKGWVDAPTLALTTSARETMPEEKDIDYNQVAIDVGPAFDHAEKLPPAEGGF